MAKRDIRSSDMLIAYGFLDGGASKSIRIGDKTYEIEGNTPERILASIADIRSKLPSSKLSAFNDKLQHIADHDWQEISRNQLMLIDYPKPISKYFMSLESWHNSIEPYYYWCINYLGDIGFGVIDKVTDIFTAAEHSSFYGAAGQRLALAQDRVSQYLATIGKMVKDMFQLVRELRIIDERLGYYRGALGIDKNGKPLPGGPQHASELALKGLWVDLVDGVVGGQRTGSNLFTMAQQLQFTTLPDFFFKVTARKGQSVDDAVKEQAQVNESVQNALKRKLEQYYKWRDTTYQETLNRRKFTLKYLYQHNKTIEMYIKWVKPYLKHIERLSGDTKLLDNPRIITAFESSLVEVEIIARMRSEFSDKHFVCIMLTFEYSTKPTMQYPGDTGQHRGPIHVGTTRITWRSYTWTDEQIKNYISMRNRQDVELIASIDSSLQAAMDALGDDLMQYINEVEAETSPHEEKEELKKPIEELGKGLKKMFGVDLKELVEGIFPKGEKSSPSAPELDAKRYCFIHYNIFKKSHGLLSW